MDKRRKRFWMVAALSVATICVVASPADAEFPEGWSIVWTNVNGGLEECTDFARCSSGQCPAQMYFAEFFFGNGICSFDNISGEFEPGKTRTQIICWDINWVGFGFVPVREAQLDVTCSRIGGAQWFISGFPLSPASCAAELTLRRILPRTLNISRNEGLNGVTVGGRRKCAGVFFGPPVAGATLEEKLEMLDGARMPEFRERR